MATLIVTDIDNELTIGMRFIVVLLSLISAALSDEISRLPGAEKLSLSFKHYSGFFRTSETHYLHYWFVESQHDPRTDPLIFWFNGGPGCSSIDGLLNEMGPYLINDDGKTLRVNEFAWNKFASVVYIESPAGVGYSYSTDGDVKTDDDQTAVENYMAVKTFFKTFPHYRNHSLFVMGESYGGVYVPMLSALIVAGQKQFPINFKGVAIGNGYVSEVINLDTAIRFAYGHGIIDEKIWRTMESECCGGCVESCDIAGLSEKQCTIMVEDIFNFMWTGGLNPYDLYRNCDSTSIRNSPRMDALRAGLTPRSFTRYNFKNIDKTFKFLRSYLEKIPASYGGAPCLNDSAITFYMNSKDVRSAIHIPHNVQYWQMCSDEVVSTYVKKYGNMEPFIKKILSAGVKVLLYYGDTDMACNFMMGQEFTADLNLPRKRGKTAWKFENQIAGFTTLYDGLTFATIRGAGHMAPQWRAPQSQHLIKLFLLNTLVY